AGRQADLGEAAQVLRRFTGGRRLADVALGDLLNRLRTGVGDLERDGHVAGRVGGADGQVRVPETGVGKAEAEGVGRGLVLAVLPAVADVDALRILHRVVLPRP